MDSIFKLLLCIIIIFTSMTVFSNQEEAPYTTAWRYNLTGQVLGQIQVKDEENDSYPAARYTYNQQGLLLTEELGWLASWQHDGIKPVSWSGFKVHSVKKYGYDSRGFRVFSRVAASGSSEDILTQTHYNERGQKKCETRRLRGVLESNACTLGSQGEFGYDRKTEYHYDINSGNITQIQKGFGSLWQNYATYTYKGLTHLVETIKDANGNLTRQEYDDFGRLEYRYYPAKSLLGSSSTSDYQRFYYDKNDNLTKERKRSEKTGSAITVTNVYDALNRLIKKDYTNNSTIADVHYGYNNQNLELFSRFGSASVGSEGLTHSYDGFGNLRSAASMVDGKSLSIRYGYDKHNNRERLIHPDTKVFSYEFDQLNRVTNVSQSNSLLDVFYKKQGGRDRLVRANGAVTQYELDEASRLLELSHNLPGSNSDITYGLQYNPASQLISLSSNNAYYLYSGSQNVTGGYEVNGLNQYTDVKGESFDYDANGNLTYFEGDLTNYSYDVENRLLGSSGLVNAQLVYDPKGRLAKSTVAGVVTRFLWDGDALLGEYKGSTLQKRYVHGDQVDEPWVQFDGSSVAASSAQYFHSNQKGSIVALSNFDASTVKKQRYDVYGIPANTNTTRFAYTGQLALHELGLYSYKARFYHPRLGRFLQTDPVGYEDQMNLYAYVGNDPMNNTDPTGKITRNLKQWIAKTVVKIIVPKPKGNKKKTEPKAKEAKKKLKKQQQREKRERAGDDIETHNGEKVDPKTLQKKYKSKHGKNHATRKRARDAARRRGDSNNNNADGPHRKGGRHFHPKDADGNEIHDGMHDNFPF